MALPDIEKYRVDKLLFELIVRKAPALFFQDHLRITATTRGNKVTLAKRPYFQDPTRWTEHKVAQFEYDPVSKKWNLYCYDRKQKRLLYTNCSKCSLDKLVAEVIKDPTDTFWEQYAKKDQLVSKKSVPKATYEKIKDKIIAKQPKK